MNYNGRVTDIPVGLQATRHTGLSLFVVVTHGLDPERLSFRPRGGELAVTLEGRQANHLNDPRAVPRCEIFVPAPSGHRGFLRQSPESLSMRP